MHDVHAAGDDGPGGAMKSHRCLRCEATRDAKRLPRGWHRDPAGNSYCADCWRRAYILRAVTIPVAGPVDVTWPELRERLKMCWRGATRLSNWAVTELAKADVVRTPPMDRLPKPPTLYLYPGAREMTPELDTGSVVAILHAVEQRWRRRRYEVVWLGTASLPNYRYAVPYPVRSQDWKAMRGRDGEALVSVRLAGQRMALRLRGGRQFGRQLQAHRQLVDGAAVPAELALYEQASGTNDHRPGTNGRDSGGQRLPKRLMCKLVAWLPRPPSKERTGTLYVRTDSDALLIALDVKGERLWVENCDQLRRWVLEHRRKLNRWADDQKAEQRPTARYQSRREASAKKFRRRINSLCHEVAAHLANFARRRGYATVKYDDSDRTYCERFGWEQLRSLVAEKLDAAGITFERSDGDEKPGTSRDATTQGEQ